MNLELSWHDEHKVQRYPLPEARPVTIGWQDCDIILSDKTVSRRNMHLYVAEGSFHLKNLSQTNAIYVYTQQELEPGQTMLLSADSTLQLGTEQIRFKLTPTDNTDYWLTFVSDQRTYQFSKEKVVMGRHDTCDIALDNRTVSRQHAEIFFRAGQAHVRNLSPTNDVYVRLKYHLPQGGSTTLSGVSGFRVGLIHIQAVAPDAMGETEKALATVYKVTCPGCARKISATLQDCPWCGVILAVGRTVV